MYEPDVTLTDYALTLFCLWLAGRVYLLKTKEPNYNWVTLFFLSTAIAALLGGTVHGFFPDENTLSYQILWRLTLLAIGLTALSCAKITAWIASPLQPAVGLNRIFLALLFIYSFVVTFVSQKFWVAILAYSPSMIWLGLVSFRSSYLAMGVGISILAAIIQITQISIHPVYFNHNALYHLIQAGGLYFLFLGFAQSLRQRGEK